MSQDSERSRLDDAARAGWLYFIAGNTQDEIAKKLNVSRPTAQPRPSDRRLHGARRAADRAPWPRPLPDRADRSRFRQFRRRSRRGGGGVSGAEARRGGAAGGRRGHRADASRRRRADPAHELPAAPARLAGRPYLDGGLGQLLRRAGAALRSRARAALSDAAAGRGAEPGRARPAPESRAGPAAARTRRCRRCDAGRHRADGRERAAAYRRLHFSRRTLRHASPRCGGRDHGLGVRRHGPDHRGRHQ